MLAGIVRMGFSDEALERAILPAFAHAAATDPGPPMLEVLLWSGDKGLDVPWILGDVRSRGDIRGFEGGPISVFSEPVSSSITLFDREQATIVYWVADPELIPWHERGAPLRAALHHWAADAGRHFIHGGAVGTGGAGVPLAGASGSGKSTTRLSPRLEGLGSSSPATTT